MLFISLQFVAFFFLVYGAYRVLPFRWQNPMLLVASYYFYGVWDWRFLLLLVFSSTMDYFLALAIGRSTSVRARKTWVTTSMVLNLGILGFFKYFNFFAGNFAVLLHALGLNASPFMLQIVLPVGISFYTFQSMSYIIDVYRGELAPVRRWLDFALFVAFFPQLVAGPIVRAKDLLTQIQEPRVMDRSGWREGCWLILLGYYKKVVLADNLAPFANEVFNSPDQAFGLGVLAGILAFAFQIYGDFSGYSDIARGISRLMGFHLMLNFRMPYFAVNPSDFWRRWHISLSTWLRDYLYIPLGGNRGGEFRMYRNLALTMLLGGLWHGAAWHFVAWGAYHGLLLILFRLAGGKRESAGHLHGMRRWAAAGFFFIFTLGGWLLFRANQLADVPLLLGNLFQPWAWSGKLALLSVACFAGPLMLLELLQERQGDVLAVKRLAWPIRYAVYAFLAFAIFCAGARETYEFIYFQF